MINEQKFTKQMAEYNKYVDKVINEKSISNFEGVILRIMLNKILQRKNIDNNITEYDLNSKYIKELIIKGDYIQLHDELQKVFNEFIPFIVMRRFLLKLDKFKIEDVCSYINIHKKKYNYTIAMDYAK